MKNTETKYNRLHGLGIKITHKAIDRILVYPMNPARTNVKAEETHTPYTQEL